MSWLVGLRWASDALPALPPGGTITLRPPRFLIRIGIKVVSFTPAPGAGCVRFSEVLQ